MSEIVASNVHADATETEQVIDDMQNVCSVDKAAKLSTLLHKDAESSCGVVEEIANGDQSEKAHHNGTSQNGDATAPQTADTNPEGASNPVVDSEHAKASTEENPVEASGAGTGNEKSPEKSNELKSDKSPEKSNESNSEESSNTGCETAASGCAKTSCGATDSTCHSHSATSTESSECSVQDICAGKHSEGEQVEVNKQMEGLTVESESSKGPSPAKKSCSPF